MCAYSELLFGLEQTVTIQIMQRKMHFVQHGISIPALLQESQ